MSRFDTDHALGFRDEAVHPRNRLISEMAERSEEWMAGRLGVACLGDLGRADEGWDLEYRGWTIDVKWTTRLPGPGYYPSLNVPAWKPLRADLYVLVVGPSADEFAAFEWCDGWATREAVLAAPVSGGGIRRASGQAAPYYRVGSLRPLGHLLDIDPKATA